MSVLSGKRIVITRASDKAQAFADQLRALGADPIEVPTIKIVPVEDKTPIDETLKHIRDFDWIIFTSGNAVEHFSERLREGYKPGVFRSREAQPQIAVIGSSTAGLLRAFQIEPAIIANPHTAEGLFQTMSAQLDLKGLNILLPQGNLAKPVLGNLLREAGAKVTEIVVYRNIRPEVNIDLLHQPFDAITFTSSSAIENFCSLFDDPLSVIGSAFVVCIGPVTDFVAKEQGLPVHISADPHTMEGLLNALITVFERNTVQ